MKVSEERRRALFERVRDHLDGETATMLVEVTMPANIELATRGDIPEFRAESLLRFAQLEGRIAEMGSRLDQRITDVGQRLDQRIPGIDQRLADVESGIAGLGPSLLRSLHRIALPIILGGVAVIVGLATWIGIVIG